MKVLNFEILDLPSFKLLEPYRTKILINDQDKTVSLLNKDGMEFYTGYDNLKKLLDDLDEEICDCKSGLEFNPEGMESYPDCVKWMKRYIADQKDEIQDVYQISYFSQSGKISLDVKDLDQSGNASELLNLHGVKTIDMDVLITTDPLILENINFEILKDIGFKEDESERWDSDVYSLEVPAASITDSKYFLAVCMSNPPVLFGFSTNFSQDYNVTDMPGLVARVNHDLGNNGVESIKNTVERTILTGAIVFSNRILEAFERAVI